MPSVTTSAGTWPQVVRKPLSSPQAAPIAIDRRNTSGSAMPGCWESRSPARKAVSPTTEPTDRSTLRVMITSVWPTARSAKIDALSARLRSDAVSTKRGSRMPVTAISSASATTMPSSRMRKRRSTKRRGRAPPRAGGRGGRARPRAGLWRLSCRCRRLAGGEADDALLVGLRARHLAGQPALVHDEHAVGHAEHLGQLARDHQHREPLAGELAHQPVDLGLRADLDATRGLVDDQHLRPGGQPLPENHLLLVAARQCADAVAEPVVLELQPCSPLLGERVLGAASDQPAARERPQPRHRRVAGDREVHDETLLAAVLREEADTPQRLPETGGRGDQG